MNILYVYADTERDWNCSEWRCAVPSRAINDMNLTSGSGPDMVNAGIMGIEQPHTAEMLFIQDFVNQQDEARNKTERADLIVVQRLALANIIPRIVEAQANGKVVVVDIDDAYHFMPDTVTAYKFWHEGIITVNGPDGKPQQGKMPFTPVEQLEWGIKLSHGVTTPSPTIAEDWKKFNPNTWVVPNYIATQHYLPYRKERTKKETITIGWGGSHSHFDSWKKSNIVEALRKICVKNKNVRIMICGNNQGILSLFRDIADFNGRITDYKWVPHNEWPRMLTKFDIGLVPLVGKYDARRSWIKTLEYTLMGIPWVGTKAPPTEELAEFGRRASNSVASWEREIQAVIDDMEAACIQVDAGFETAMKADVNSHTLVLLKTYEDIYKTVKGDLPEVHQP
jgi:hypothetical protein